MSSRPTWASSQDSAFKKIKSSQPGMVVHAFNTSTQEAEDGSELEASLTLAVPG